MKLGLTIEGGIPATILWLLAADIRRTAEQNEFGSAFRMHAERVGRKLLEASDEDQLADAIDAALESQELRQYVLWSARPPRPDVLMMWATSSPELAAVDADEILGAGADAYLKESLQLTMAINGALASLGSSAPTNEEVSEALQSLEPLWMLEPGAFPPEVARALLANEEAVVCTAAIMDALLRPEPRTLPAWLVQKILQRWVDGQRQFLRLLASTPEIRVPVEVVPLSERLDWKKLQADHHDARAARTELFEQAAASEQTVYPPFEVVQAD